MSKKITELEKILRKVNDATNKIIVEVAFSQNNIF